MYVTSEFHVTVQRALMLLTKFKTTKAMIRKSMNPKVWYLESNDINQLFFFFWRGGGGRICVMSVCLPVCVCLPQCVCA